MSEEVKALISFLSGKSILIAGFGREGQSTLRFIQKYGSAKCIIIADMQVPDRIPEGVTEFRSGLNYLDFDPNIDIIIRSPGISMKAFEDRWKRVGIISSQTDLMLRFFRHRMIGVTGTKGKSTTTTLLFHFLQKAGIPSILAGNMGLPFFDQIQLDFIGYFVAELSSHQLETTSHSPRIAVLLNVFPEHLDHYDSFAAYRDAKLNIGRFQARGDVIIIPSSVESGVDAGLYSGKGEVFYFGEQHHTFTQGVFIENDIITCKSEGKVESHAVDLSSWALRGIHNQLNVLAAMAAAMQTGIDSQVLLETVASFNPLPHRLERVGVFGGITFINDSISTIPQSAIAALMAFPEATSIIVGGYDRMIPYEPLVEYVCGMKCPFSVIWLGTAGKRIATMLEDANFSGRLIPAATLEDAVFKAFKFTLPGSVCLLSPAASSYDQFKNFEHRGDEFKRLVLLTDPNRV